MLLKRPATLHLQEGLFVPEGIALDEVDGRWEQHCLQNPACFDGTLLHVLGAHRNGCGGAIVHVMRCSYRFFGVQTDSYDVGIRPLGVKGITHFKSNVLWGKRSNAVRHYAGQWEYAPAGSVEPGTSPEATIESELLEETGLTLVSRPIAIAMLFDEVAKTWELIYRLQASSSTIACNSEYLACRWLEQNAIPEAVTPVSRLMMPYA
jgi:8-oxo-dGTP pyrophosphatase MutT (NUDIX family)